MLLRIAYHPCFEKEVSMTPKNNDIYRHFKGNLYKVITMATHSETEEQMVVYQGLYGDFPVYCRPLSMFLSEVDHDKYPEVTQKLRFERVDSIVGTDAGINCTAQEMAIAKEPKEEADKTEAVYQEDVSEVDPLVLEFLEAETVLQKKNILTALHHRITDDMINTLAVVMDVVIEEGELENRYRQLKTCLETIERYEIERK